MENLISEWINLNRSHISMLILEVRLPVVTDDPVRVSDGRRLYVGRGDLSVQVVVETLEQTVAQVHVADGVDALWEVDWTRQLAVSVSPLVLDTFHVPLVDYNDNLLVRWRVNSLENVAVSHVYEDVLHLGEVQVQGLDEPVHLVGVEHSLTELAWLWVVHSVDCLIPLISPQLVAVVLNSSEQVVWHVHPCLMVHTTPSLLVELCSKVFNLRSNLLCLFTRKLHLEAWLCKVEVRRDFEMELEGCGIQPEPSPKEEWPWVLFPQVETLHPTVLVKVFMVVVELLLRVDVLKHFGCVPPLLVSLDKDCLGLHFLDKLLSSLGEHSWLVRSAY